MGIDRGKLALKAFVKFAMGAVALGALLFLPAGSWGYYGAWRLLLLLFIPMFILGVVLLISAPELLVKRLEAKERRGAQSGVVKLSALMFIAVFVVAGLDFRFGWSCVGGGVIYVASVFFLISYALYGEVMRENEWLARTVEVVDGQQVVSTGLYGIVRHPMYAVTIVIFLAMPLILGSWWAFAVLLLYIPLIVIRVLDEERLLRADLDGYSDYCERVRWRLVPFIW